MQDICLLNILKNGYITRASNKGEGGTGGGGRRKASANVSGAPAHVSSAPGSAVRNESLTPDRCLIPESPRVLLVQ